MDPQPSLLCTAEDVITSTSSMDDIIDALTKRSCSNLTACINLGACSKNPYTGGGFCDVYRGELYNGTKVAIKCLRVYDGPQADDERKKILKHAARELYHWSKLQHRNVLPLMGLALFRGHISMISEWMDNGSLMQYIRLNQEVNRIRLCKEVCAGLCYIHASGMIHGDLKSANVMISGHGAALIADFGNSWLKDVTLKFSNTVRHSFSMRWAAPELLLEDECPQATKEADVYAYAMTMLEILTGKIPYDDFSDNRVIVMVAFEKRHPPRPESDWGLDDSLWELLVSCWCQDPSKRPTIKNINDQLCSLFPDSSPDESRNIVDLTCMGTPSSDDTVSMSGIMPVENVTATLTEHGVVDLTSSIDLAGCAVNPFARRGLGTVYKGRLLDNQAVVIKSFRLPPRLYSQEAVKAAATELGFWARLRHRNIMPLMGCASFRDEFAVVYPTIATRIAPSYLRDHPNTDRFSMCIDICSGVSYIHQRGMIHGDLKGENVFVSSDGTAMIGDFGDPLLKALVPAAQVTTRLGTRSRWTAPELFLVDGARPSRETDVYALGMTILEITTGRVPYEGMSDLAAVHAVAFQQRLPPRPESGIPDGLWDTMVLCWRREPEERPGSASIANRLSTLFWRSRLQGMNLQQVSRAPHTTHIMEPHGISRSTRHANIGTDPHQPGDVANRHSIAIMSSQSNGYDQLEWVRGASPDSRPRKTEDTLARVYRDDLDLKLLLPSSGQSSAASAPPWGDELAPELESEGSHSSGSSSSYCTASGDFPENESLDDLT